MEKSYVDRVKEALVYAPVGAFGFVKDNAPTFFTMFVSRGKREVTKTTLSAEEKLNSTKEQGQMFAMGTPVMKTRADKIAGEAKSKGEEIAKMSVDVAIGALGFLENAVKNIADAVANDPSKLTTTQTPHPSSVKGAASTPMPNVKNLADIQEEPTFTPPSSKEDLLAKGEGTFIAEPVDISLPDKIRAEYGLLTAPEIIDRLDDFQKSDLENIRDFEAEFRNRQTIIHAINYRLTDN